MTGGIERRLNEALRRVPWLRLATKRAYQTTCWLLSPKQAWTPGLAKPTQEAGEHLCGYYDKSPWDASGRRFLTLRVPRADRHPRPGEVAEARVVDIVGGRARLLASTRAWNLQQGCMLQWLGPDFSRRVVFNDLIGGAYRSVLLDLASGGRRVLPMPVYAVSTDGRSALTLDFARLHRMRPGYGYGSLPDATAGQPCPEGPCIWRLALDTGEVVPVLDYADLLALEPRAEMAGAEHKVNHIMINPSGSRFMFLHRWVRRGTVLSRYTRLVTANLDGSGLFNLLDDDMTSHCWWRDDSHILAYARRRGTGDGYLLLRDRTGDAHTMWPGEFATDGHPSYSPDGRYVVTDTYPDRRRMARVIVIDVETSQMREAAHVFAPFRYDNDTRCDLHPRWSRDGRLICFDSAHEGTRQSYIIPNPFTEGTV
jgi:hypothetical protein